MSPRRIHWHGIKTWRIFFVWIAAAAFLMAPGRECDDLGSQRNNNADLCDDLNCEPGHCDRYSEFSAALIFSMPLGS